MEMTYREPQNPLFPRSYVNLVNKKKEHWKIGKSEHNTDCDVTVGITNSYATTNICIYPPHVLGQPPAKPSEVLQVLWRNKRGQQRKWQIMEINVMFQAVQGMWSAGMGWCLYSERHRKQIMRSNKITQATKGTWLAASGSLLQYIRFHLPHKQSKERWLRMMANDLQILSTTDKHLIL